MDDPINFDIPGLICRYQLHPERKDVFVESRDDQGLTRAFLDSQGLNGISVYPVSVVNISAHTIIKRHLPHPSARSEIISLALELEENSVSEKQVACIADADFEYLLPQKLTGSLLLLTDYASMEMYSFTDESLQTILLNVAPATSYTGAALIMDLAGPLQILFSARAANVALQTGLAWIENIDKFFSYEGKQIEFDEKMFFKRYVEDRLPKAEAGKFMGKFYEIQALLSSDIRCRIRGHDFIKVLLWFLKTVERCKHLNEFALRNLLYVSLKHEHLAGSAVFSSLVKRLKS